MKTVITICKSKPEQWKVETLSSAENNILHDLYLQVKAEKIVNDQIFYTDSNGWLVMKRKFKYHEDYKAYYSQKGYDDFDGNTYPMTAFSYIKDINTGKTLSVNTDRPQGVISAR